MTMIRPNKLRPNKLSALILIAVVATAAGGAAAPAACASPRSAPSPRVASLQHVAPAKEYLRCEGEERLAHARDGVRKFQWFATCQRVRGAGE